MEILSKLFGGAGIVKMLRLFLFNPQDAYEAKDIAERTKTSSDVVRSELQMLERIGFVKKKSFFKEITPKTTRRRQKVEKAVQAPKKKKRVSGWTLNQDFLYLRELQALLIGTAPREAEDVVKRLRKVGSIKAIVVAGVFVHHWDGRLDLLIVGENVNKRQLSTIVKDVEAGLGREIRYAVFGTQDFRYRLGIYDRLVRDVLDYPHQIFVDKIGISR